MRAVALLLALAALHRRGSAEDESLVLEAQQLLAEVADEIDSEEACTECLDRDGDCDEICGFGPPPDDDEPEAEEQAAGEEDVFEVAAAVARSRGATDGGDAARRARGLSRGISRSRGGPTHSLEMQLLVDAAAARRSAGDANGPSAAGGGARAAGEGSRARSRAQDLGLPPGSSDPWTSRWGGGLPGNTNRFKNLGDPMDPSNHPIHWRGGNVPEEVAAKLPCLGIFCNTHGEGTGRCDGTVRGPDGKGVCVCAPGYSGDRCEVIGETLEEAEAATESEGAWELR